MRSNGSAQSDLGAAPSISIVTASRNRAHLLPRAIESVLNQTWRNWELLIVDDGSVDDTRSVVEPYLEDPRIQYYRRDKRGFTVWSVGENGVDDGGAMFFDRTTSGDDVGFEVRVPVRAPKPVSSRAPRNLQ